MSFSTRRLFVAVLLLALFAMAVREVADPDFWWHLRTGQFIVETRSIPHTDVFSFTNVGKEWVTHEWLSQVIIYALYRAGGLPLLIVSFAALVAAAFGLTFWRCPGRPYLAGFVVVLGAAATAPTWGVRPQIVSLLLTSFVLLLLDRYRERGDWRYLVPLVPLAILWVNLHSGFALEPVIIGVYLAAVVVEALFKRTLPAAIRPLRDLGLTLALCVLAIPLNPNGLRMFSYPFETLTSPAMQQYIQEWFSPDFHLVEFQPFALLLLALVAMGFFSRARIPLPWLLLTLLFGYAALRSARQIPFFALVAVPALAAQLTELVQRARPVTLYSPNTSTPRVATLLNSLVLLLLVGVVGVRVLSVIVNQRQVEAVKFPASAVQYIASQQPAQNLYNTYGWGGYLIWRLYPDYRVYIDGRADVYGDKFIEDYLNIYRAQPGWDAELARANVRLALVEPDSPIAYAMASRSDWRPVYSDKLSIIFERK